jgi:hypothetical protein
MINDQNALLGNMGFNTNQRQFVKPNNRFTIRQNSALIASLHTSTAITLPTCITHGYRGYSIVVTTHNY